jgi:hypothetical protein
MTMDDILQNLTSRYECRQGLYGYFSNVGLPYVMIGSVERPRIPGTVGTGEGRKVYETEALASTAFLSDFNAYAAYYAECHPDTKPTLWWRYTPPLNMQRGWRYRGRWYDEEKPNGTFQCFVKCRLLLSAEPVRWATQEAYDADREEGIVKPYENPELVH